MLRAFITVFFCIILVFGNAKTQKTDDLLAVAQVIRHGQITPYYFYPKDPHKSNSLWNSRKGSLTNVGKQQEYNLGKYTRKRYSNFLPSQLSWVDFLSHSTDTERTKTSCQSFMAGVFSKESETWSETLPLHKYYFHLSDEEIFASSPECDIYELELAKVLIHGEMFESLEDDYVEIFNHIRVNTEEQIKSIFGLYSIYETLYIEEQAGLSLPSWTEAVYPEPLRTLAGHSLKALTYTEEAKRLAAGSWLFSTLNSFELIFEGHDWLPKYQIYSGHDTNIAAILNTIEAFTPHVPEFGASIYFELRNKSGVAVVNVWYKTESGCEQLSIACCDLDCPLVRVKDLLKDRLVDKRRWKYECRAQATQHTFIPREEKRIDVRRRREEAVIVLNRKRPEYKPYTWVRK